MNPERRTYLKGLLAGVVALLCPWRARKDPSHDSKPDTFGAFELTPTEFTPTTYEPKAAVEKTFQLFHSWPRCRPQIKGEVLLIEYEEAHYRQVVSEPWVPGAYYVEISILDAPPFSRFVILPGVKIPWGDVHRATNQALEHRMLDTFRAASDLAKLQRVFADLGFEFSGWPCLR